MKFAEKQCDIVTKYLIPVRIVCEKDCADSAVLLEEHPRQAVLADIPVTVIKKGGYVVLDFGKEIHGGADITVKQASDGAEMRLVFGESVSEAMSTIGEKNAANDHAIRDTAVKVTNWQHFKTWNTGFRFLKLEAIGGNIAVSGVQAAFEFRDLEYKGSFKCDDEVLNKVWEVGAYTVHLNMQEYLWDGIKRDRLVWIGDMHPETSTILSVFGNAQVVKDSLDFIKNSTPTDKWMNGIASYSLWWMIIHFDWYMQTGDLNYLLEQKDYILSITEHTLSQINDDGTHRIEDKFVEWSARGNKEEDAGMQAMLINGLKCGEKLCGIFGETDLANRCRIAAEKLKTQHYEYAGNKQIAAMVSLAGTGDGKYISDNILKPGGAEGLSTFWGYYTLQALAKTGDYAAALDIIRNYWGLMLKFGATTFWEDFDVKWTENASPIDEPVPEGKKDLHGDFGKFCYRGFRHSLCHGWASGPTAFLSRGVLGIECVEPGFAKVKIAPHLDGLKWAEGTYPTPHGIIKVRHENIGGKIVSKINVPKGTEVVSD